MTDFYVTLGTSRNIHTPPTEGIEIFLGVGLSKTKEMFEFPEAKETLDKILWERYM